MALKDVVTKDYMQLKDVFADVFNFFLHDGKPVIQPHQLKEKGTEIFDTRKLPSGKSQAVQQYRDLLCILSMEDSKQSYLLLGIENQTQIHYALPVRNMFYDALQYRDQIKLITRKHRMEQKAALQKQQDSTASAETAGSSAVSPSVSSAEFLSGFCKDDRLHPVITLVIYFGSDPWDGPRCVHEMFADTTPELLAFVPDYQLHLIEPAALSDGELNKFQTNLREVLTCIKYSKDKERLEALMHDPRFSAVQYEAAVLLNEIVDLKLNISDTQKGDAINMCIAFEQIKEDCRRKGIEQGHAQGHAIGRFEANLAAVQSIIQNLNLDIDEAIAALDLPLDQQELVRQKLTQ